MENINTLKVGVSVGSWLSFKSIETTVSQKKVVTGCEHTATGLEKSNDREENWLQLLTLYCCIIGKKTRRLSHFDRPGLRPELSHTAYLTTTLFLMSIPTLPINCGNITFTWSIVSSWKLISWITPM